APAERGVPRRARAAVRGLKLRIDRRELAGVLAGLGLAGGAVGLGLALGDNGAPALDSTAGHCQRAAATPPSAQPSTPAPSATPPPSAQPSTPAPSATPPPSAQPSTPAARPSPTTAATVVIRVN